jgi:hypothetical protein
MLTTTRTRLTALAVTGALSLGGAGAAEAATQQDGLVNVNVENVTAQVPIGIAANVCDVNANVLAEQLRGAGASCDADATTIASNGPGNGGGSTHQSGLVNVNAEDIVVQVPVALAANICDVNVGVLSRQLRAGGATCDATADAIAQH